MIRYMILSPSEEARQAFLGRLFGTFELPPKGKGEKAILKVEDGELEVVGTGKAGTLLSTISRIMEGGVQLDGILILIPSGDENSWQEAREVTLWVKKNEPKVVVKTWVFGGINDLDKETAKKAILTLVLEHTKMLND
jgi:hypothetical protein